MTLRMPMRVGPELELAGDTLSLWCYAEEEITAAESPYISVQDSRGNGLPDAPLLGGRPIAGRNGSDWIFRCRGSPDVTWTPANVDLIFAIYRHQYHAGARRWTRAHAVYRRRACRSTAKQPSEQPPAAPEGLTVEGQDSHFDLTLAAERRGRPAAAIESTAPRTARVFSQSARARANFQRFVDFVGGPGKTYHYKISAVDLDNNESPLSESAQRTTSRIQRRRTPGHGPARLLSLLLGRGESRLRDGPGSACPATRISSRSADRASASWRCWSAPSASSSRANESVERMLKIVRFLDKGRSLSRRVASLSRRSHGPRLAAVRQVRQWRRPGGNGVSHARTADRSAVLRRRHGRRTRDSRHDHPHCGARSNGTGIARRPTAKCCIGIGRPITLGTSAIRSSAGTKR